MSKPTTFVTTDGRRLALPSATTATVKALEGQAEA